MAPAQIKSRFFLILGALVIILSLFTHLYRINSTYIFQGDEGRDILIAYKMIASKKPVLLGPQTSVGNMYLGPFYYYLLVPPLLLSRLDPVGPAIMVAFFGVMTTLLLILLGKKYYSLPAGLVAALFYATSPVMLHYSRSSWNPNVIPFFAALMLYFYPLKTNPLKFIFGILSGILFQLHYVALILPALLYLKHLYHLWFRSRGVIIKDTLLILLGFFLISTPFWLFEIRHNFINSNAFITYLTAKSTQVVGSQTYFERLLNNIQVITSGIISSSSLLSPALSPTLIFLIGIVLFLSVVTHLNLLGFILIASLLLASLLKEKLHVHYVSFLYPPLTLLLGYATFKKYLLATLTLIIYLALFAPTLHTFQSNIISLTSSQTVRSQSVAEYIIAQADGRPYNVTSTTGAYTTTINYFLAISDNPPQNNLQDLIFVICLDKPCSDDEEITILLFLSGPAHPSLSEYLGHPELIEFSLPRKIIKNDWVAYDAYVATLKISN